MRSDQAPSIRRQDYTPPSFLVPSVTLEFDLDENTTIVTATLRVERQHPGPLTLHGDQVHCLSLHVDGQARDVPEAGATSFDLDLPQLATAGAQADLQIVTRIHPGDNQAFMGLYASSGLLATQCEAQGFRRITYFPDRPDIMSRYQVTLRADRKRYPILLSNGNLSAAGELADGRHFATWDDPFLKPSYLFALVAGDLVARERTIVTESGKQGLLQVWTTTEDHPRTEHALDSLEHAIRWDETRYGLPLDLDRFMIVAVADFNMGAMENKGLNIFNTKYVLADPNIATDDDYLNIEAVVGHEYFHNWTGNRITCRDWFQLTLKEGLTVFRDQEFTSDRLAAQVPPAQASSARAVKRIDDVAGLRAVQFPEDQGPMAHPIRPDAYREINNFYTATVYEKGAEVIRMMQTLVGRQGFRQGMDLYFARHDGQAVTCDDFIAAMFEANADFVDHSLREQFTGWYSQAGTPRVAVVPQYDAQRQRLSLKFTQTNGSEAHGALRAPLLIPLQLGLVHAEPGLSASPVQVDVGTTAEVRVLPDAASDASQRLILLSERETTVVLDQVPAGSVPSLNRNFSAPIHLDYPYTERELATLLQADIDPFNRWDAGQQALTRAILAHDVTHDITHNQPALSADLLAAFGQVLNDRNLDPAFAAQVLALPGESYLFGLIEACDPSQLRRAREAVQSALATAHEALWLTRYHELQPAQPYRPDPVSAGQRALRLTCLSRLVQANLAHTSLASQHYHQADNMTDRAGALQTLLAAAGRVEADATVQQLTQAALEDFAERHDQHPLAMDKWFALQAMNASGGATLQRVQDLMQHPRFDRNNPNKLRALLGSFLHFNLDEFHRADGAGYVFWAEQVCAIDQHNPQVAARLTRALDRWRGLDPQRRALAQQQLQQLAQRGGLSGDVTEIIGNALQSG